MRLGGIFDYAHKQERLQEVELELGEPSVWDDPDKAQALGKERAALEAVVGTIDDMTQGIADLEDLLDMALEEDDESTVLEVQSDLESLGERLDQLEFRRMFSGEMDANNAFMDIQSGSGGTEAQDWAEMLLRMYLRWGESKGFKTTLVECSAGEVAIGGMPFFRQAALECLQSAFPPKAQRERIYIYIYIHIYIQYRYNIQ